MDLLGYPGLRDQAGDCLRSERFKLWVSEGEELRALGFGFWGFGISTTEGCGGTCAHDKLRQHHLENCQPRPLNPRTGA